MSKKTDTTEVKQGNVSPKDVAATKGGKRFHVDGLRGSFMDTRFGDDCHTETPVSPAAEKALRELFGDALVEVTPPARKPKGGATGQKAEGGAGAGESAGAGEGEGQGEGDPQ